MTQGNPERYHRSLKNVVKLDFYYTPREVERAVGGFAEDCNHRWYHEALQNVTPADMFFGRQATILARRARIKQRTLQRLKRENLQTPHHAAIRSDVSSKKRHRTVPIDLTTYTSALRSRLVSSRTKAMMSVPRCS